MPEKDLKKLVKDFVTPVQTIIHVGQTIEEALAQIRQKKITDKIVYFYVLDGEEKLAGIVSARALLLNDPSTPIENVMGRDLISVGADQSLREGLEILESHHLLAIPVLDREGKFLGIVDVDFYLEESIDVARAKRRMDIFQMIGFYVEDGKKISPWKSYRIRMPWIFCNMIGGFACAGIARGFEMVISKVIILAMFIPLLLTLSESISMQSMTQSLQLMRGQKFSFRQLFKRLSLEWKVLSLLSATSGLLVGFLSLFWGEGIWPGVTIATSIFISILVTATIGASVPLILHARKWDPKVSGGPVVLMFADVLTTVIYLSLATWWLL